MQFVSGWVHGSLSSQAKWVPGAYPSLASGIAVPESTSVTVSGGMDGWCVIFDKCLYQRVLRAVDAYRCQKLTNTDRLLHRPANTVRTGAAANRGGSRKGSDRGEDSDWKTWALPLAPQEALGKSFPLLVPGCSCPWGGDKCPCPVLSSVIGAAIVIFSLLAVVAVRLYRAPAMGQALCTRAH